MQAATPLTSKAKVAVAPARSVPCQVLRPAAPVSARRMLPVARVGAAELDEIQLLEKALSIAKERATRAKEAAAAPAAAPAGAYTGPGFTVKTFNAISPVGLSRFPAGKYVVSGDETKLPQSPMAIMLRSHQLKVEEVPHTVRCIVRCGAGVNNIPVQKMTELGVPVFNTPGANANAVKELVICAMLLASRGIVEGHIHTTEKIYKEEKMDYDKVSKRIEKDKAMFVGNEIEGKTLGVVGLGAIGGLVVKAALALGMKVIGFDPVLSLDAAWKLPGDRMMRADSLDDLLKVSDFITVHVPYIKGANGTHHMINGTNIKLCKPNVHLLNFARGEIIDGEAVRDMYTSGRMTGKYVSDFADPFLSGHPRHLVIPHLGASTEEAEDNSAAMAADTVKDFLETGTIRNSVNFPQTVLDRKPGHIGGRLCIVHRNEAGVLGQITTYMGSKGINIEQQINTSRGEIAYTVLDFGSVPDAEGLQQGLGAACQAVISSRFIGDVFDDELGQPGKYFFVRWAK
uniref:Phosphoglycerate dehydrogenase n=1 Tax=Chlamydomonas leiostraca TaxID=1034604 RepID=A0A7S0RH56_9CHLO|mmetsp:Transcript_22884/g.58353  ORF Transcript_22884/g.58353 Transcript_22884/m.58353 type:complete len:514 (+) Transcript_22884:161-1702(+)